MKLLALKLMVSLLAITLAGCAEIGARDFPPERVYIPAGSPIETTADGSIFSKAGQDSLLGQDRARRPGDLITILVDEQVSASTSASSNASRNSATTALTASALGEINRGLGMQVCRGRSTSVRAKAPLTHPARVAQRSREESQGRSRL